MSLAKTVQACLARRYLPYAVISHTRSLCARETARAATVPPTSLAKAVVLGDDTGRVMAVVPGDRYVDLKAVARMLNRRLRVVAEASLRDLFDDCELGAIPPLGPEYDIETVVDESLLELDEVCFLAGSHNELVCVNRDVFLELVKGARFGPIGRSTEKTRYCL